MEALIFFGIGFFLFLGVIGSVIPILPGPLLSYIALLLYHFFIINMNISTLIWFAVVMVFIILFDYFLQIYGVKKVGGGKYAIRGSIIGIVFGFFFPPLGILVGAFLGAFLGAKMDSSKNELNIALGSVVGFVMGTILKICVTGYIVFWIIESFYL